MLFLYALFIQGVFAKKINPGHALHEKGSKRQMGVGTLVSSQDRKAPGVPLINRGSTARCVPRSVYIGFPLFVLPKGRPGHLSSTPWGARGSVVSWANRHVGVPSCPSPLRPGAPRCAAPPRPAVCPGFGLVRCCSSLVSECDAITVVRNKLVPR